MTAEQRTVLITGAAGGIGRATVQHFAAQGWRVFGVDRVQFGKGFPAGGVFIKKDISKPRDIRAIFNQVKKETRTLNALVNNAAVGLGKRLLDTRPEEWEALMDVNLRAPFLCTQQAYPLLKAAQGAVVNVSSVHAVATSVQVAAYAASKGALLALTRAMAIEFAPDGVRANAILPGAVDTKMLRGGVKRDVFEEASVNARLEALAARTVIGRIGTPDEIARGIYFLADNEQSSFMTGQPLIVDGGATTRLSTE
ncbi:MAG: SDR family oxidoreductase [Anaerolineae bacterium]|nr:MAG: SDR family oxidoreductase [Anaerolineae bacterium]